MPEESLSTVVVVYQPQRLQVLGWGTIESKVWESEGTEDS